MSFSIPSAYGAARRFLATLLDLVAPPRRSEALVRSLSLTELQELVQDSDEPLPYRNKAVTALVWELKYRNNPRAAELAGALLGERLLAIAAEELGPPLLVPVPMHALRLRERGYNQTELLCQAALPTVHSALEYAPKALMRVRETPPQQTLPRRERLKNMQGAMVADPERVRGRACIVVDDVETTGATLHEAKRALRIAGARAVHCVSLARS